MNQSAASIESTQSRARLALRASTYLLGTPPALIATRDPISRTLNAFATIAHEISGLAGLLYKKINEMWRGKGYLRLPPMHLLFFQDKYALAVLPPKLSWKKSDGIINSMNSNFWTGAENFRGAVYPDSAG